MVKANLKFAGHSDAGRARRNNEDAWHIDPDRGIFLVVDGIGGQNAGEKAAEIAVSRVRARLERQTGTTEQRIREAITVANNEIVRAAATNPDWHGMACVLTVAVLENGSAIVGHVGDSRLYLIQRGDIRKITHDHSPVGEREDAGEISEAEAMRHPRRNEVYRDVGSEEHSPEDADFIELRRIPFEPDSALVLCSDGLSDQVTSREIRLSVERNAGNPAKAVAELIDAANRAGAKDNVTVLVVEGEHFAASDPVPAAPGPRRNILTSRMALFLYGLLLAAAAAWLFRVYWVPPPKIIQPRLLVVGRGAVYDNIAAAVAEARAGDTVEVLSGEYPEQVRLKSDVLVRSRARLEAVLRAAPQSTGPAVLAQGIKGARFSGFRIQADQDAPLSAGIVLDSSIVEIDDVEVSGAGIGVEIRSGAPSLVGNSIHDCTAEGVLITGSATPWISHNSIRRNKAAGLAARGEAKPVLTENLFEKNSVELPPGEMMELVRQRNQLDESRPGRKR